MQLAFTTVDEFQSLLEQAGEALDYREVWPRLFPVANCPPELMRKLVADIVESDERFLWESDVHVGLAAWRARRRDLADVAFTVVDLETTGATPGFCKITEIGAVRVEGGREVAHLLRPRQPGHADPGDDHRHHRHRRRDRRRRAAHRGRAAQVRRLRRALGAGGAQRPVRPRLPRLRAGQAARADVPAARARHAAPGAQALPAAALLAAAPSPTASTPGSSRCTARCTTRRPPASCCCCSSRGWRSRACTRSRRSRASASPRPGATTTRSHSPRSSRPPPACT